MPGPEPASSAGAAEDHENGNVPRQVRVYGSGTLCTMTSRWRSAIILVIWATSKSILGTNT